MATDIDASILGSLRCFEAAARHLNFTRAAAALHLTQSAVSQQIRILEDRLGFPLFARHPRGLKLTPEGHLLFESVRTAFAEIGATLHHLGSVNPTLQVNCLPSLALHWLVPRLGDFYRQHPNVSVRLTADLRELDPQTMREEAVDLGIRYEPYRRDSEAEVLMAEYLFPVATPEYLARYPAFAAGQSCEGVVFLHDASPWVAAPEYCEWQLWLTAEYPEWLPKMPGPEFNMASLMISAALNHQGVALGRTAIVADELESGRLVDVFSKPVRAAANYILLEGNSKHPHSAMFRRWISSQFKQFEHLHRSLVSAQSAS